MKLTPLSLLSLFLASCAIGPDYITPQIELSKEYAANNESIFTKENIDIYWWKTFNDESLNSLITETICENKDVKQSLSRINQARALARQARSELLPGAALSAGYEKSKSTNSRFPNREEGSETTSKSQNGFSYELYHTGIDALWELDIFGRLRRDLESKNAAFESSIATLNDTIRIIIAEVGTTYFGLRSSQAHLEIAKKNVAIQQNTLEIVRSKFELGQTSNLDVAQAETQLEETLSSIPQLEAAIKVGIHRLSILQGKKPSELESRLISPTNAPKHSGTINIGAPADLLRKRPDIKSAERELASHTAQIGVALGELFPKVSIQGSIGVEAPTISNLTSSSETFRFGPAITWTPFDLGKLRSRVTSTEERTLEALLNYEQVVLSALEEVENSLVNYTAERTKLIHLKKALESANSALEIARNQYEEGVLDFISVLQSQEIVFRAESNYAASEQKLNIALVGIYKALGGGWEAWDLNN
jgi:outer membrane protein, multidrug efflux system